MQHQVGTKLDGSIVEFLCHDKLPKDKRVAHKLQVKATRFCISSIENLYKQSYSGPYLLCIRPSLVEDVFLKSMREFEDYTLEVDCWHTEI